jgi:hypothetical protein
MENAMAHLKELIPKKANIVVDDVTPYFVSMHKGILKPFGGRLDNLFDSKFDNGEGRYSRGQGHQLGPTYKGLDHHGKPTTVQAHVPQCVTKKDFRVNGSRNYRPWQFSQAKSIKQAKVDINTAFPAESFDFMLEYMDTPSEIANFEITMSMED